MHAWLRDYLVAWTDPGLESLAHTTHKDPMRTIGKRFSTLMQSFACAAIVLCVLTANSFAEAIPKPQPAPVVETIHGVKITDPYRYLEDSDNPATRRFMADQTAYAQHILEKFPGYGALSDAFDRLTRIGVLTDLSVNGAYLFFQQRSGVQNQPVLYVQKQGESEPRVLIDVNALSAAGTVALDWYAASPNGKYVAYGLSDDGTEISTLHVIEVATGTVLNEAIDPAREAFVAWLNDESGFYYGRPRAGRVPVGQEVYEVRIYRHRLGQNPTGDGDTLIFGDGLNLSKTAIPVASVSDDDRFLVFTVHHSRADNEVWIQDLTGTTPPRRVTSGESADYTAQIYRNELYLLTNQGAARYRLVRAPATSPDPAHWQEAVPESDGVLVDFQIAGGKLLLQYETDAASQLIVTELDGTNPKAVKLAGFGSLTSIAAAPNRSDAYYVFESYDTPPSGFRLDMKSAISVPWRTVDGEWLAPHVMSVQQKFFGTKDGTRVPMFLVARTGTKLDGKNATILSGYGGFGISETPYFSRNIYAWVAAGGVWGSVNLRGGGEYGDFWHQAGILGRRQNVFDDFTTAAHFLIDQGWTNPEKLGLYGASNGGLVVTAAVTQHPDLFRAAVANVPLTDMLRYDRFGIARLWIPEFGTAADPGQFSYLRAYSPYHNVIPGTRYPAMLFLTGESDTRVAPLHALKMAALMQAEAANGADPDRPILLRVADHAGHGAGKPRSAQLAESIDTYSFLFWQLGLNP